MLHDLQERPGARLAFGDFELLVAQRILVRHGAPVKLGGPATALLIALVERAGELLSRRELEAIVWPDTVVEDTSLRVHVAALRKALGDDRNGTRWIVNVPGRGYCFVAPVQDRARTAPAPAGPPDVPRPDAPVVWSHLPRRLSTVVGRDDVIAMLRREIATRRLITLVGPGGIGKTAVALAVAHRAGDGCAVCFVDLLLVNDPAQLPASLAAAFGITDFPGEPLAAVARLVGDKPVLVVLDNCEHVIDAAAAAAVALLAGSPGLRVLATSREALGTTGEWLHRLPPLRVPDGLPPATLDEALHFPAVQLFVDGAGADGPVLSDPDAAVLADVCRRLGGMPLAIEIAAARLQQFGLQDLAAQVDAGFLHLRRARRTWDGRHDALAVMLDWSHRLLSPLEKTILRRVGIFRSPFSLGSAIRVCSDDTVNETDVVNALASLRAKSLLHRVALGDIVKHQLLEHTRAYALEKLTESGDEEDVRRRHAGVVSSLLAEAQRNWPVMSKRQWLSVHGTLLPAIQTANRWAFSATGNPLIGASLTSISWPVAHTLFLDDYEFNIRRAIESLERLDDPPAALLIRLHVGLATQVQERNGTGAASKAAYRKAADLAAASPDPALHLEAQIGTVLDAMGSAESARAVAAAERLRALAAQGDDSVSAVVADRLTAQALHLNGEHRRARPMALAVRDHLVRRAPLASLAGVVDHQVSMNTLLARANWLEGLPDQAAAAALEAVEAAESDSALALCQALALAACPVALWRGDDEAARRYIDQLFAQASGVGFGQWVPLARGYQRILSARRSAHAGESLPPAPAADGAGSFPFVEDQLAALDAAHWHEATRARVERGDSRWCAPEVWRLQGLRHVERGALDAAEQAFTQSMALAHGQHALAWSLRSATSLAVLHRRQGRREEAFETLHAVFRQFGEGAATTDLRAAAALLDTLSTCGSDAP